MPSLPLRRLSPLLWISLAGWLGLTAPARAQSGLPDLKLLSLEELTQVEVTSVSRQNERLMDAAAAVEVLTSNRIMRAGATTIPDALRLATGMQVSQLDGREWTISERGFATVASNKMEVNQDGRSLYGPLFSGVLWDIQSVLWEDLDRIEIVRGPGAALWGANAVNGVISIVTKPADETQGLYVRGQAGTDQKNEMAVRYGGQVGPAGFFRIFANAVKSNGLDLTTGASADDGRRLLRTGGRLDLHPDGDTTLTFQSELYRGLIRQVNLLQSVVKGGYGSALLERSITDKVRLHVLTYFDHAERRIPVTYTEIRSTGHLEVETRLLSRNNAATMGVRVHVSADRIGNGPTLGFIPSRRTISLYSLYGQDRYTLPDPRWKVTVGSTLEHNTFTGVEFQPTARLSFSPTQPWMVWVGASRAVRTPSRIDTDVVFPGPAGLTILAGSPAFKAEDLESLEAGWRWHHGQSVLLEVDAFDNRYDNLRSIEPGTGTVLFVNGNKLNARSRGLELSATVRPVGWARLIVGARLLDLDKRLDPDSTSPNKGTSEGNDAARIVTAQLSLDLPHAMQFDVVVRHASDLPQPAVPSYTTADLRLAWQFRRSWELAISGRNLFAPAHVEGIQSGAPAEKVRRNGAISLTWRP